MAYKRGKEFFLRYNGDLIVCEQTSDMSISNTGLRVRCKNTGDYGVLLEGGIKEGSFSFTGAYVKNPETGKISAIKFAQDIGKIGEAIWGGGDSGDDIVTVDVQLSEVSITADMESEIQFSGTLDFAGEPEFSTVS